MSDPLASPVLGAPSPFLNRFATVNQSLDLLRKYRRESGRGAAGAEGAGFDSLNPAIRILIRNDTQAALNVFDVVKIGDPVLTVTDDANSLIFAQAPIFKGTTPAATTDQFAIVEEPIPYPGGGVYAFGRAVIQGVVPVDVNITNANHSFATPTVSDQTKLTSALTGPARILYKPSGTGTKRCVVALGSWATDVTARSVQNAVSYDITADTSWEDVGGVVPDLTISQFGRYELYMNASALARCSATPDGGYIAIRLWSETESKVLLGENYITATQVVNVTNRGSVGAKTILPFDGSTIAVPTVIRMEAQRGAGPTWTLSRLTSGPSGGLYEGLSMGFMRIGD